MTDMFLSSASRVVKQSAPVTELLPSVESCISLLAQCSDAVPLNKNVLNEGMKEATSEGAVCLQAVLFSNRMQRTSRSWLALF